MCCTSLASLVIHHLNKLEVYLRVERESLGSELQWKNLNIFKESRWRQVCKNSYYVKSDKSISKSEKMKKN